MDIEFECNVKSCSAAFQPFDGGEDDSTARLETVHILRDIADKIERALDSGACIDSNGNVCGGWFFAAENNDE